MRGSTNQESLQKSYEIFKKIFDETKTPVSKQEFINEAEEPLKDYYSRRSLADVVNRMVRHELIEPVANEDDFDKMERRRFSHFIPANVNLNDVVNGKWYTKETFEREEEVRLNRMRTH